MQENLSLPSRTPWFLALLAGLLGVLYFNGLASEWTFDDWGMIVHNPQVQDSERFSEIWTHPNWIGQNNLYRPVTVTSFALNSRVSDKPWTFRVVNILLHVLCTFFVFFLGSALFPESRAAVFGVLLFAVHPIHTEAVTSVVGRAELLSCFFALLSLLLARWHWQAREGGGSAWILGFLLCGSSFLALLSKEVGIAAFPLALLWAWREPDSHGLPPTKERQRKRILQTLPWLVLGIVLALALRVLALGALLGVEGTSAIPRWDNPLASAPMLSRIWTALWVFLRYLGLLFFPWSLSADYSFDAIPLVTSWSEVRGFAGLAGAAVFFVLGWSLWQGRWRLGFALALFVCPFLVISNLLFPIGTILGERLLYFPSVGFCLAIGWLFAQAEIAWPEMRRALVLFFLLLLVAASWRTVLRNRDWQDHLHLFSSSLQAAPRSAKMQSNLGLAFAQKGAFAEALRLFRRAVEIDPEFPDGWHNLAHALAQAHQLEPAQEAATRAVQLQPEVLEHHLELLSILEKQRHPAPLLQACQEILERWPEEKQVLWLLARTQMGEAQYQESVETFERLVQLEPDNAALHYNLGSLLERHLGLSRQALLHYREALQLEPEASWAQSLRERVEQLEDSMGTPSEGLP